MFLASSSVITPLSRRISVFQFDDPAGRHR